MSKTKQKAEYGESVGVTHTLKVTVPKNWEVIPLEAVLEDIVGGGTPSRDNPSYWNGSIPWLTVKDMRTRRPDDSMDHISEQAVRDSATNIIPADTVIIATRIGLGKVIRVPYDAAINQDLKALITKPTVDKSYLEYWIYSIANYLESIGSGTTVKGIRLEHVRSLPFPLAPLDQQKQIVAEIEKQFSRLDEAVANLKRVKANLKRYKATVLKAAVEGRLAETEAEIARREGRSLPTPRPGVFYVYAIRCNDDSIYIGHTDNLARRWEEHLAGQAADWTKQHKPMQIVHYEECSSRQEAADREKWLKTGYGRKWIKREIEAGRARQVGYETGAQLLQRILETRRSQWLARADKAGGKGKGKYKEPAAPDTTDLPELPEGWVWLALHQFAALENGDRSKNYPSRSAFVEKGIPFINAGHIEDGKIGMVEMNFISEDRFALLRAGKIKKNDLLFCLRGSLGKVAIVRNLERGAIASSLVIVRPVEDVMPEYLLCYLMSALAHEQIRLYDNGSAQPNLSAADLGKFVVPVPPATDQHRIIAEVDRRFSLVREVEAQVEANLRRAERMRQSILRAAFVDRLNTHSGA